MAKPQIDVFEDEGKEKYYVAWWSYDDGPGLSIGEKGVSVETLRALGTHNKKIRLITEVS